MRKAKGLEADVVILVGLENDLVPGAWDDIDTAEQARLFYVSMTRAKQKLYLFHSYRRPGGISYSTKLMQKERSKFLDALGRKSEYKRLRA
jgi:superfamily I DNA/RNA helicase